MLPILCLYGVVWLTLSMASWWLARLLCGRAGYAISSKEFFMVGGGCVLCGLLPLLFSCLLPATTPFDLFFILFGGTFFRCGLW